MHDMSFVTCFCVQAKTRINFFKSIGLDFVLQDSFIDFDDGSIMSASYRTVKLVGNNFTGSGSIMLGAKDKSGVDLAEVFANSFDSMQSGTLINVTQVAGNFVDGVHVYFGRFQQKDRNFIMRNNELVNNGQIRLEKGSSLGCDVGNVGRSVGCDSRAECIDEFAACCVLHPIFVCCLPRIYFSAMCSAHYTCVACMFLPVFSLHCACRVF